MLIDEVAELVLSRSPAQRVRDLRIGLGYTAALLDDGRCGVAYTFREEAGEGCSVMREAGGIAGLSVSEVVAWARSSDAIASAVGLAAINALTDAPADASRSDPMALLNVQAGDQVGMVGSFGPLIEPLQARAGQLLIFERYPERHPGTLPQSAAPELLPRCQIVILSATTLLNRTIDDLLVHCRAARDVVLLGPSTPFVPEVLADAGVTLLSGVQVTDAPRVLAIVSEGGGTRQLHGAARKITLRVAESRVLPQS